MKRNIGRFLNCFFIIVLCVNFMGQFIYSVTAADTTPPQVSLDQPSNNAVVSGTITIKATATDNVGVMLVAFYIDGDSLGTDSSAPYQYQLDTTQYDEGTHTLKVKAVDNELNADQDSVTITIDNYQERVLRGYCKFDTDIYSSSHTGRCTFYLDIQVNYIHYVSQNKYVYSAYSWSIDAYDSAGSWNKIERIAQNELGSSMRTEKHTVIIGNKDVSPSGYTPIPDSGTITGSGSLTNCYSYNTLHIKISVAFTVRVKKILWSKFDFICVGFYNYGELASDWTALDIGSFDRVTLFEVELGVSKTHTWYVKQV